MKLLYLLLITLVVFVSDSTASVDSLRILTVATETNDALTEFLASAKLRGLPTPQLLGLGSPWRGGDVARSVGGGQKILLMRRALAELPDDQLVLFSDSYDAVFLAGETAIRKAFEASRAAVLISAEAFCWPDQSLADKYPKAPAGRKAYLNSGGYIGSAGALRRLLNYAPISDSDDDQLFLTRAFVDPELRQRYSIALDYNSAIFQSLNGALAEVSIRWDDSGLGYIRNTVTGSLPAILHGNGPIKSEFWRLANYLNRGWSDSLGCQQCPPMPPPTLGQLLQRQQQLPLVTMGVLLTEPTPFPDLLLNRLAEQTYPKQRIHLRIDIGPEASSRNVHQAVRDFVDNPANDYASIVLNNASQNIEPFYAVSARRQLLRNKFDSDFILFVEPIAQLTGRDALAQLVTVNRSIVAPLLVRPGKLWSNFWGALNAEGYYARSDDYLDIVSDARCGLWNVPYISAAYLISSRAARILLDAGVFNADRLAVSGVDFDVDFASIARTKNVFMHVLNTLPFGHLTDNSNTTREHASNDLWEIWSNPVDWEQKYIHPDYWRYASEEAQLADFEQPCPDVFWLPLVTPKFCTDLVAVMESYGSWSDGSNTDPRLEGGYENVPTRDIHMRQVGWESQWLHFLVKYMHPVQLKLFQGYHDKPWARMNFVVRYHPDEQKDLRPHHDASDYTVNLALNQVGVDFEGGGCRFPRYNCSVIAPRLGWAFVHPGRITHLHEGLEVTKGVRYIFVTFVNP